MLGMNNYGMVPNFGHGNYGSFSPSFAGRFGTQMPVGQFPVSYGWNNSVAPVAPISRAPWTVDTGYNTLNSAAPISRAPWTVDAGYNMLNNVAFGGILPNFTTGTVADYGYTSPIHSNFFGSSLPFAGLHTNLINGQFPTAGLNSDLFGGQFPTNQPMNGLWNGWKGYTSAPQHSHIAGNLPFGSYIPNSPITPAADFGFVPSSYVANPVAGSSTIEAPARSPLVNLWEGDASLFIDIEVPGVNLDDIDLKLAGHTLIIKTARGIEQNVEDRRPLICERALVGYTRAIQLPVEVDCENVDAKLINGILRLVLPKVAVQQRRTIRVSHLATA